MKEILSAFLAFSMITPALAASAEEAGESKTAQWLCEEAAVLDVGNKAYFDLTPEGYIQTYTSYFGMDERWRCEPSTVYCYEGGKITEIVPTAAVSPSPTVSPVSATPTPALTPSPTPDIEVSDYVCGIAKAWKNIGYSKEYGVVDADGNIILPFEYEFVSVAEWTDGEPIIIARKAGFSATAVVYDKELNVLLDSKYTSLYAYSKNKVFMAEKELNKYILLDSEFNEIAPDKNYFPKITYNTDYSDVFIVRDLDGSLGADIRYVLMDRTGNYVSDGYGDLSYMKNNRFEAFNGLERGVIDASGNIVIPFEYSNIFETDYGYEAKNKTERVLYDFEGNELRRYGYTIGNINDPFKRISRDVKYAKREDGKEAFADENGELLTDFIYDDIRSLCLLTDGVNDYECYYVRIDGVWQYIDTDFNFFCLADTDKLLYEKGSEKDYGGTMLVFRDDYALVGKKTMSYIFPYTFHTDLDIRDSFIARRHNGVTDVYNYDGELMFTVAASVSLQNEQDGFIKARGADGYSYIDKNGNILLPYCNNMEYLGGNAFAGYKKEEQKLIIYKLQKGLQQS